MKKYMYIVVAAIFVTFIMSGCSEKETTYMGKRVFSNLKFDKEVIDVMVTPESDEFSVDFYNSGEPVPDDRILSMAVVITNSTVKIGSHVTSVDYDERGHYFVAKYDTTGNSGSIKIKVDPQLITEPSQLTLETEASPKSSVTINLIPTL